MLIKLDFPLYFNQNILCSHVEDLEQGSGYWLWLDHTPTVAAIWGLNKQSGELSLFIFSLCYTAFQIHM